ncbi:MAG: hypothetical protein ACRD29_13050 [Acidimicrobiales bacterium]
MLAVVVSVVVITGAISVIVTGVVLSWLYGRGRVPTPRGVLRDAHMVRHLLRARHTGQRVLNGALGDSPRPRRRR